MDDAVFVRFLQRRGELTDDGHCARGRHRAFRCHHVGQLFAVDKLHHQKRRLFLDAKVEHLRDARVIELADDGSFAPKAIQRVHRVKAVGPHHLDGDRLIQAKLRAAKDHAHGALAKDPVDAVLAF